MSRTTASIDAVEAEVPEIDLGGMVVTSQPDAVEAGLATLRQGGNAVDAAVAAALALGVVDPMSTGIGGDCFALVWKKEGARLEGINGSGRAPAAASLEDLASRGLDAVPADGPLPVTVPGAVGAFDALLSRHGTKGWADVVAPAVTLADEGFAVTPVVARDWAASAARLRAGHGTAACYLVDGEAPREGDRFRQPDLAASLRALGEGGADAFYRGPLGEAIAATAERLGGWLRAEDLAAYAPAWVAPLEGTYRGHPVYELPPNGQGVVVLEALALLEQYPLGDLSEVERTHVTIEALKLAFADAFAYVADPDALPFDPERLLDLDFVEARVEAIGTRAAPAPTADLPAGDTVYVTAVDAEGNACSLIHSVYMHFGAAVVADGTGICLQNRGHLFSADPAHPNALGPGKLPYHTIIPAMVFRQGRPWLVFGVVGGYQQPQAQVQILTRLIDLGASLKDAVDAPRFRWIAGDRVRFEAGFDPKVVEALAAKGHVPVDDARHGGFGGAQAILVEEETLARVGATDPRKDGKVGRVGGPKRGLPVSGG